MIVVVQSREKFLADKEKAYQAGLRKGRADRIEALEAENERLRTALHNIAYYSGAKKLASADMRMIALTALDTGQ